MKRIARLLFLLGVFIGIHAGLRILFWKAMDAYEMSLPHCCMSYPVWILWVVKASDFFTYFPSYGAPISGDLFWGCAGTALYLWAEKWWNKKQKRSQILREVQEGAWPPSPKPSGPAV